jgi:hypothetical protein
VTPALFGFVGVIAGAVLTGLIQWIGAWADRRRARRTAARLLFSDLKLATDELATMHQMQGWPDAVWALPRYVKRWPALAETFSTVGIEEFKQVDGAFARVETLITIRTLEADTGDRGWSRVAYRIEQDAIQLRRAAFLADHVGRTRRERRRLARYQRDLLTQQEQQEPP